MRSLNSKKLNRSLKLHLLLLVVISILNPVKAQESSLFYGTEINKLFSRISLSVEKSEKDLLSDSLVIMVEDYLLDDFPFKNKIDGGRYLGQIYAPDSLVKIISWNIAYLDGSNRYTAFIVRESEQGRQYWKLDSRMGVNSISTDNEISYLDWYGSLYYDIQTFKFNNKTHYLLLGLDLNGYFTHGKVVDILWFNNNEDPVFGVPAILLKNTIYHRLIFKYSAEVAMMLRFDSDSGRVVFDHLSPASPKFVGEYQYYGPDFSYDGLEFKDGLWRLIEDIELRNK